MALNKKGKKNQKLRQGIKRQEKRVKQMVKAEGRKAERVAQGLPPVVPKPPKHKTKWAGEDAPLPPPQLIDLLHEFLRDYRYIKAAHGVRTDNQKRPGHNMMIWKGTSIGLPHLNEIFTQWKSQNPELAIADHEREDADPVVAEKRMEVSEDEDDTSASSGSDSDSSSDSEDDEDDFEMPDVSQIAKPDTAAPASTPSLKRKASDLSDASPDSESSSGSDDDSASSVSSSSSSSSSASEAEVEAIPKKSAKRAKTQESSVSAKELVNSKTNKAAVAKPAVSEDSSSSDSESESDSGSESDSENESSSSSSEIEEPKKKVSKATVKPKQDPLADSTDSSATLNLDSSSSGKAAASSASSVSSSSSSSSSSNSDEDTPAAKIAAVVPKAKAKRKADSPPADTIVATDGTSKRVKAENKPFSRIPENIAVDPRFESNEYVPYNYADKSHEALSAVRGKGFTKEKNKKKRGQGFRGGMIDIGQSRGVKFDD